MAGFDVALKAGIVCDGRILVLGPQEPERQGEHDLPGGRMEYGEDPLSTLHREVYEETGLTVQPVAPVRMWSFIRANGQQLVGVTWACRGGTTAVRLSAEHVWHRWLAPEEIPEHWVERPELLAVFDVLERLGDASAASIAHSDPLQPASDLYRHPVRHPPAGGPANQEVNA